MLDRISLGPDLDDSRPSRKTSNHQNQRKLSIFTTRFRNALKKSVEGIIEAGRVLIEAKNELEHGQFIDWVVRELRFGTRKDGSRPADLRKAQILMFLARNEVISNANHWYAFPPSLADALGADPDTAKTATSRIDRERDYQLWHDARGSGRAEAQDLARTITDAEAEARDSCFARGLYRFGRWRWRSRPYSRAEGRR